MTVPTPSGSKHLSTLLLAACFAVTLAACNGGDGTLASNGPGFNSGGSGGTGVSFGRITGFGSIFVNGNRFDTDGAVISVNGAEVPDDGSLSEGMLVRVQGDWSPDGSGTASRVDYDDTIRGPVGAIALDPPNDNGEVDSGTFTVLEQTIAFDRRTVFRGTTPETLSGGDLVRISGWRQGDGAFLASLVQIIPAGDEFEVEGFITELEITGDSEGTFSIGSLAISFNNATEIEMDDDRNTLIESDEGAFVEVEGTFAGGVLTATEIEEEDDRDYLGVRPGDDIEFEGPISSVNVGDRTFIVHGITVRITNGTEFDDGLRESDLQPGLQVEIEGDWNADNEVVAEEIELRDTDSELEARILAITDATNRVLDVGGVRVQVTSRTLIVDDDDDDRLDFTDLRAGDSVEVDGIRREDADGFWLEATRIEREDDDDDDEEFELTGLVDSVGTNHFFILGVRMDVDVNTEWDDDGLEDLNDLRAGDRVEVEYEPQGNGVSFLAKEVEREDD